MENLKKIEQLEEKILEELNMELQDYKISSVKENIKSWEKAITSEKLKNYNYIEDDLKIIEELKKFIGYDCLYVIDSTYGGCWGQGFTIVDNNLNYIGFVRTI